MRGNDLHQILTEKARATGGYFRSAEYRLALFLLTPDVPEAERFIKTSLRQSLERVGTMLNSLPPEQEGYLLGEMNSPVRQSIERMLSISGTLSGEAKVDPALEDSRRMLLDLIDDEAIRIIESNRAIRVASNKKIDRMPDRLQKSRALAEQALTRYLLEPQLDEEDWLKDASNYLDEVLQQPVGQRDCYTWLLNGWLNLRRDNRDGAQNSFLQACLAASADRDILFVEANRILARGQMDNGAFEAAYQTLIKIPPTNTDPLVTYDQLCAAIGADRVDEARSLIAKLCMEWPVGVLGVYGDQELLAKATSWRGSLEIAANSLVSEAKRSLQLWQKTNLEAQTKLSDLHSGLELPSTTVNSFSSLDTAMQRSDMLLAAWVRGEAQRGLMNSLDAARLVCKNYIKECQLAVHRVQNKMDDLKEWKSQQFTYMKGAKYNEQNAQRQILGLDVVSDRTQTGCMMSAGLGCAGYASYFIVCFVSASVAATAGPNTATGKFVLGVIGVPLLLGVLITVADGLRRMVAEAELGRQMKQIEDRHDIALQDIEATYKEKMPPLMDEMKAAKAEADRGENALKSFQSLAPQIQDAA